VDLPIAQQSVRRLPHEHFYIDWRSMALGMWTRFEERYQSFILAYADRRITRMRCLLFVSRTWYRERRPGLHHFPGLSLQTWKGGIWNHFNLLRRLDLRRMGVKREQLWTWYGV
jgi:hypothetical protein